ncbi:MAG: sigma-70 family RNA polymerase sigma factor [Flavobacteriales bacterium]|nr:sigma-70 family RNA polymerase sigma factor [Flavobacteriales bacterium]
MSKTWHLKDERELIDGCIKGNVKAQRELFDRFSGKMLGICFRYCTNLEDARDAMQMGFIKTFNLLEKFKGNSKLETWMTRIMINTAIDLFKKNNRFELYDDPQVVNQLGNNDEVQENLYLDTAESDELTEQDILELINELPDGYRIVFNLYAIDGLSHRDIAAQLGISEGTSKSQLARARKLLKHKILSREILE